MKKAKQGTFVAEEKEKRTENRRYDERKFYIGWVMKGKSSSSHFENQSGLFFSAL